MTICDEIGISHVHVFCAKSVGVTIPNYLAVYIPYKHTNGFTEAIAMLGKLALMLNAAYILCLYK